MEPLPFRVAALFVCAAGGLAGGLLWRLCYFMRDCPKDGEDTC